MKFNKKNCTAKSDMSMSLIEYVMSLLFVSKNSMEEINSNMDSR
jgi:hypothetical protein